MAVHKIFRGDRTRCAQLYPMARQKLGILREVLLSSGQTSATQRFDLTTGEIVMIYVNGTEEYIYITAGGDGYYCLGDLGGSENHISASPTARGAFFPRGSTQYGESGIPSLRYVGRGKGLVVNHISSSTSELYETRQGVTFKKVLQFDRAASTYTTLVFNILRAARAEVGDTVEKTYGVAHRYIDPDSQYWAAYLYTLDGADNWSIVQAGYENDVEVGIPAFQRVGPRAIWGFVPAYLGSTNSDIHSSFMLQSGDNGQTLSSPDGGDLVGDITDTTTTSNQEFNTELAEMALRFQTARLHNSALDIMAVVVSRVHDNNTMTPRIYRAPIDTGIASFVTELPLIPGDYTDKVGPDQPVVVQDVPVCFFPPDDPAQPKSMFVGDVDGASWTHNLMPWPAHSTGVPTAINERTIVCTAYNPENGHYELYQTEDLGQMWQFRATVRTDAPPPDESVATLLRFGVLSILRQRGRPANSFPGQPWVGDNRITPPGA